VRQALESHGLIEREQLERLCQNVANTGEDAAVVLAAGAGIALD
jgi:hypothetical protein